jgi:hypothetical protein
MGILARLTGKTPEREQPSNNTKSTALYRGVQVIPSSEGCCREAKVAASQRYLSHEIPRLPLESCDFENCQCTYELFNDRRAEPRRASDIGYDMASSLRSEVDLRSEICDRRRTS